MNCQDNKLGLVNWPPLPGRGLHFLHPWDRLQSLLTCLSSHVTLETLGAAVDVVTAACGLSTDKEVSITNTLYPVKIKVVSHPIYSS